MHMGRKNRGYQYNLGQTTLTVTTKEKDVGVIVTPDLKSTEQVARAAASANSMVGRIRRTFTYMDVDMFKPLYSSLIRPKSFTCKPGLPT